MLNTNFDVDNRNAWCQKVVMAKKSVFLFYLLKLSPTSSTSSNKVLCLLLFGCASCNNSSE